MAMVWVAVIIHPFDALYQFSCERGDSPAVEETFRMHPPPVAFMGATKCRGREIDRHAVDPKHRHEVLFRDLLERRPIMGDPGIVDEDVGCSETLNELFCKCLDGTVTGHVDLERVSACFICDSFRVAEIDVRNGNRSAEFSKSPDDARSKTGSSSRDDRCLAFKVHVLIPCSCPLAVAATASPPMWAWQGWQSVGMSA